METDLNEILDSIIIRFSGEMWIKKAWTRRLYERRLLETIRATLNRDALSYKILRHRGRLILETDMVTMATEKLTKIFGISSVSPAMSVTSSHLEDVIQGAIRFASIALKKNDSFAVQCRRVGSHPYSSNDVCKKVGQRVLDEFGERLSLRVDLSKPAAKLMIEVRQDTAFIFNEIAKGVGGMPLGTQAKALVLLSGGIDSAVACWLVMKRGCPVLPVYFDNAPYADEATTDRAVNVAAVLFDWAVDFPRQIYAVEHGENLQEIIARCPRKWTCLLCKRMMYRVAERLATFLGAEGIVTGEAIGEQASQTLVNLRVLDQAVQEYPVLRPLLGFDKEETERVARRIGTYKVCARATTGCTAAPYKPSTAAKLQDVLNAEKNLNIDDMVNRTVHSLRKLVR